MELGRGRLHLRERLGLGQGGLELRRGGLQLSGGGLGARGLELGAPSRGRRFLAALLGTAGASQAGQQLGQSVGVHRAAGHLRGREGEKAEIFERRYRRSRNSEGAVEGDRTE